MQSVSKDSQNIDAVRTNKSKEIISINMLCKQTQVKRVIERLKHKTQYFNMLENKADKFIKAHKTQNISQVSWFIPQTSPPK